MSPFLTVNEMHQLCKQFVERNQEAAYQVAGYSRLGNPIHMLSIGNMPESSLFLGFPHPNEPLMSLVLPSLLKLAKSRQERGRSKMWLIVPVWDVDGVTLNKEWWTTVTRLIDVTFLASHFFRPSPRWQVEWTFPVQSPSYCFSDPLPETRAIMTIIDRYGPDYLFSVHNALFPEGYLLIDERLASHAPQLSHRIRAHSGIRQNNPIPYIEEWAPSVYDLPYLPRELEFFRNQGKPVPIDYGGASFDYSDAKAVVAELPMFQWPQNPLVWIEKAEQPLPNLWRQFYSDIGRVFNSVLKSDDDIPLLVSNPYYFLKRAESDHVLKTGRFAEDPIQQGKNYLQALFTMTTNLILLKRQYPGTDVPYKPYLRALRAITDQFAIIDVHSTRSCYTQIIQAILTNRV